MSDYRAWSKKNHPDKGGNTLAFQQVRECIDAGEFCSGVHASAKNPKSQKKDATTAPKAAAPKQPVLTTVKELNRQLHERHTIRFSYEVKKESGGVLRKPDGSVVPLYKHTVFLVTDQKPTKLENMSHLAVFQEQRNFDEKLQHMKKTPILPQIAIRTTAGDWYGDHELYSNAEISTVTANFMHIDNMINEYLVSLREMADSSLVDLPPKTRAARYLYSRIYQSKW